MEWKPLKGFEKYYIISDQGDIVKLQSRMNKNGKYLIKPYIQQRANTKPTMISVLVVDKKSYSRVTARLVLETFTDTTGKYVIHKDGDPLNNKLENLEWSSSYKSKKSIPVRCLELKKTFNSIEEAARTLNIKSSKILVSCNNKIKVDNYTFIYANKRSINKGCKKRSVKSLPNEKWKFLQGTDNQFLISDKGRIKMLSKKHKVNGIDHIQVEKIIAPIIQDNKARVHISITEKNARRRKFFTVAKEVYRHFVENTDKEVINLNGDLMDNRVENLGLK